jgi:large subunit ribosomal protein L15
MNLNELLKVTERSKKRLGRGIGSGRGKTAGRGTKGQKARGKVPNGFIGGTLALYKKLPYRRGLGNTKRNAGSLPVLVEKLSAFKDNSTITLQSLVEMKIINKSDAQKLSVKIVGSGDLKSKLTVNIPATKSAKAVIEKAGGQVI